MQIVKRKEQVAGFNMSVKSVCKFSRKSRTVLYAVCYGAGKRKAREMMDNVNPRMPARKRTHIVKEIMKLSRVV